jgi:predicted nucleic acid-binding protein
LAAEISGAVVADTSVAINLNATGCADRILGCLPFAFLVTDIVAAELLEDRRSGRNDAALLAELVEAKRVAIVALGPAGLEVFADLVIGPAADTLDDGEAATIAYAAEHAARPAIDERKALRICAQRFPALQPFSTVDLLMEPAVMTALGRDGLAEAAFRALRDARMRVMPDKLDSVVELIGAERARECRSLPASIRRR